MKRKPNIFFSEESIKFIKENYQVKTDKWIGEQLGLTRVNIQNFRFNNRLGKRGIIINIAPIAEGFFNVDAKDWAV